MSATPPQDFSQTIEAVFASIDQRTAHIMTQLRVAVRVLLKLPHTVENAPVRLIDLEAQAQHWRQFVPDDVELRAGLARRISASFPLTHTANPRIVSALELDDAEVQAAYVRLYGQPLKSIYSEQPPVPQFHSANTLEDAVIYEELGAELEWVFLPRGETLFRQGDLGDSLYIVANGRLRIAVGEEETIVMELSSGDTVGEMGLVSGEPRSATVYAMRDSELCRFSKAGFERLAETHHRVMREIALQMFERVRRMTDPTPVFTKPVMIALVPLSANVPITKFVEQLSLLLGGADEILHLSRERLGKIISPDKQYEPDDPVEYSELAAWLNEQEARYRFILLEAESQPNGWTNRCLHHADRVLLVGMADGSPSLTDVEQLLSDSPRMRVRKELVLLHGNGQLQPSGTKAWLSVRSVERHHHIQLHETAHMQRLARFLLGKARVLVLGGGGTRGAAHIGVIQALEAAGIEIDLIGGTSVGALMGAMAAMDWDSRTIHETGRTHFLSRKVLLDYTLPLVAFAAGRRLQQSLHRVFGDTQIEDLPLPFFCVSANLSLSKIMVHREGSLRRALRASTSIPGVYPPVVNDQGELLVDGAVFNNLPADIAKSLSDGGVVIAVDITRGTGLSRKPYTYGEHLSGWRILWSRINPFEPKMRVPNIIGLMSRATIVSSSSNRALRDTYADLLLVPPVSQFGIFDMAGAEEMVTIGYAHAKEQLAAWVDSVSGS